MYKINCNVGGRTESTIKIEGYIVKVNDINSLNHHHVSPTIGFHIFGATKCCPNLDSLCGEANGPTILQWAHM